MPIDPGVYVAYAYGQTGAATNFLLQLGQLANSLIPPTINTEFQEAPSSPALSLPTPPENAEIVWAAPDLPVPFSETIAVEDILPEAFTGEPPDLIFGAVPTFSEDAPDAPGVDVTFEMPELDVTLPAAPSLLSINVNAFNGVTIPEVDLTIPELSIDAPSIREYTPGDGYTSTLLSALQTKLESVIENGGTGLSQDVENAIWDRNREREARSARDALAELDRMEEMGFSLPPGVYVDGRIKIATETDYVNRGHSREVMIKQAELEQANVQHALTVATQLEGSLLQYTNQVEQRLFDSCKYATEAGISIYNARVQAYGALVDAYKARLAVYESQVRGELAKVEVYKVQVEAERTKAEVNKALVESYRVQIDAALSNVEIFKARIGAIQTQAEIEKIKIEIFGEQVRAYAAKVNAYTAGVEGFRATIQAEATKQEAFKSQVQAYTARVESASKLIDARINAYTAKLDGKKAEYDGYKSAISAESARVQAIATSNQSRAELYKAEVTGVASYNEVLTKQWQVAYEQAARVAEVGVAAAKANAELYVTTRTMAIEAAKVGATVSAQLGAAALNAINWSSTESVSISTSTSKSEVEQTSESVSDSTSTNYNYNI